MPHADDSEFARQGARFQFGRWAYIQAKLLDAKIAGAFIHFYTQDFVALTAHVVHEVPGATAHIQKAALVAQALHQPLFAAQHVLARGVVQAIDQAFFGIAVRNVIFTLVVRPNLVGPGNVLGKTQATTMTIVQVEGFSGNGMVAGSYSFFNVVAATKWTVLL